MKERFETFTVLIAGISRSVRRIKTEEMAEYKLKSPHVSCVYYLYRSSSPMTARELCDICDEDKASISRSIDYLTQNGFIEPHEGTQKKYRSPLFLTEKGKEVGKKLTEKIDAILNIAGSGMTEKQRMEFYKHLRSVHDNLESICDNYRSEH